MYMYTCVTWLFLTTHTHSLTLQQRARPQFEQKIKRAIRRSADAEAAKKKFTIYNPVLEKYEYIQPPYWLWPKIGTTIAILASMVSRIIP